MIQGGSIIDTVEGQKLIPSKETNKKKLIKETNKKKLVDYPDNINKESFEEWSTFKKEIKKKLPERTIKMQLKMLSKYSFKDQEKIINNSIEANWSGLYDLKNSGFDSSTKEVKPFIDNDAPWVDFDPFANDKKPEATPFQ